MTFNDLNINTPLRNAIEDIGYIYPTPIQVESFAKIMSGRDVVGIAQTGTGKTFAYLLPILRQLKFTKTKHPRVLIVVPTRELVLQVKAEVEKLAKYMNLRIGAVYGGSNINVQAKAVADGLDVVVATPGRLIDFVLGRILKTKDIRSLVIDEVDEMLNLGFQGQIESILDSLPNRRQNILFSATLSEKVDVLINHHFNFPEKIEIVPTGTPIEKIEQSFYQVPNFFTKVNLLENLLATREDMSKVLVFVKSKYLADKIFELLKVKFPEQIMVIHSNKTQNYRMNAVKSFESAKVRTLIATDIISRGIDINDVTHVINFDMPDIPENYMHRIGRTGRADKIGAAISFVNEVEFDYQVAIEALMKKNIPMEDLPDIEISEIFTEEERPDLSNKQYRKEADHKHSGGAFHTKKDKNNKVNLGGSYKRTIAAKYKKPKTRGQKK